MSVTTLRKYGRNFITAHAKCAKEITCLVSPGPYRTVATDSVPWAEEGMELNYTNKFHTSNLALLRDFVKQGIDFTVIETKHSYVLEDPNTPSSGEGKSRQASAKSKAFALRDIRYYFLIKESFVWSGDVGYDICHVIQHGRPIQNSL